MTILWVQEYWTEHSERSVLPTGLSLMEFPPKDNGSPKARRATLDLSREGLPDSRGSSLRLPEGRTARTG